MLYAYKHIHMYRCIFMRLYFDILIAHIIDPLRKYLIPYTLYPLHNSTHFLLKYYIYNYTWYVNYLLAKSHKNI